MTAVAVVGFTSLPLLTNSPTRLAQLRKLLSIFEVTMESKSGDATRTCNTSSFDLLDDDALLQVLLRCRGDDHSALGMTCKRLREMLLTDTFQKQRDNMEWAEIEARIRNPKKDDSDIKQDEEGSSRDGDNSFDFHGLGVSYDHPDVIDNDFDIIVDGRKSGKISFSLVNRDNTRFFHQACDAVSQDLQVTGCTLFDTRGKPRVTSIKNAIEDDTRGLLYVSKIEWKGQEYRRGSFVGAHALRSFLDHPKLENKWAIAVYVPDPETQFTEEDRKTTYVIDQLHRASFLGNKKTQEDYEKLEAWNSRLDELRKMDMQPFFRAGFLQVKETVTTSSCKFVFVVPSYLEEPILSKEETDAVEILEAPACKKHPTGVNEDFLQFIIESSSEMSQHRHIIKKNEGVLSEQQARERVDALWESQVGEQIRKSQQDIDELVGKCRRSVRQLEQHLALFEEAQERFENTEGNRKRKLREILEEPTKEELESQLGGARDTLRDAESRRRDMERNLEEEKTKLVDMELKRIREQSKALECANESIDSLNVKVREEMSRFLREGATIPGSNVLHGCAAHRVPEFIDVLLEAVPETERNSVINGIDEKGMTPLMCAARANVGGANQDLFDTLNKLIHLGADKNIVDEAGETALGKFRLQRRSTNDFQHTFGVSEDPDENSHEVQIEGLLLPSKGATPADDAYLSSDSESDDGEDEDEE